MMKNPRTVAVTILFDVIFRGVSLNDALQIHLEKLSSPKNFSLIKEICYGTLRWYLQLHFITQQLLHTPLKETDRDLQVVLLIGLYQLIHMRIPDYAAIAETVNVTRDIKKAWASGLINGVLRQYQRNASALQQAITQDEVAFSAHPAWLLDAIKSAWPQQWQHIIAANNAHPPFNLRVNVLHQSRADYLQRLATANIEAIAHTDNACGIMLTTPMNVEELPGFTEGDVSVQDGAAQFAATLMDLSPGQRVLDACAAPGGKTAHILETESALTEVIALDNDPVRLEKVQQNLQRLHLSATLVCGDASQPQAWWDNQLFDRILLDAPCSATGVIRRHPDIKIHRRSRDIAALAKTQLQLLFALWPLLKTGGLLVYATCSLLPQENEKVLEIFLAQHQDAKEKKITHAWGNPVTIGKQILPAINGMDGFYYGRLEKI